MKYIMKIEDLKYEKGIKLTEYDALVVVDMQYDFIPGGALAVEGGDTLIEGINELAQLFHQNYAPVILTQDWHPKNHSSFASSHPGKNPGDEYSSDNGAIGPILWPDHCVQGTKGAKLHEDLKIQFAKAIIRKGTNPKVDSYSAFLENDKIHETGMAGYLKSLKVRRLFFCGLALDYCVCFSAMDGADFGFECYVIMNLTQGIDLPEGNISNCLENMTNKGILFVHQSSFK